MKEYLDQDIKKILFEKKDSEPPLSIATFPDFKHNPAASIVTLGLDS